jgi:mRNA interferase MazF
MMIRTVEAVVDPRGNVRLLEDAQLPGPRRALVTILDDAPRSEETALLSEGALADLEPARGRRGVVRPSAGGIVLVPFPFSDLSQSKLRLAVALADAGRGDGILCQVTSNPYGDPRAVQLTPASFDSGSLRSDSYARPPHTWTRS